MYVYIYIYRERERYTYICIGGPDDEHQLSLDGLQAELGVVPDSIQKVGPQMGLASPRPTWGHFYIQWYIKVSPGRNPCGATFLYTAAWPPKKTDLRAPRNCRNEKMEHRHK